MQYFLNDLALFYIPHLIPITCISDREFNNLTTFTNKKNWERINVSPFWPNQHVGEKRKHTDPQLQALYRIQESKNASTEVSTKRRKKECGLCLGLKELRMGSWTTRLVQTVRWACSYVIKRILYDRSWSLWAKMWSSLWNPPIWTGWNIFTKTNK